MLLILNPPIRMPDQTTLRLRRVVICEWFSANLVDVQAPWLLAAQDLTCLLKRIRIEAPITAADSEHGYLNVCPSRFHD
jgi:hypothetical protein